MPRYRVENGKQIAFSEVEETARDAEEKAWADAAPTRAWAKLRRDRNEKLAQSDWMANSDVTMSADWKRYREELRQLPGTLNDTTVQETITWPTEPS